MARSPIFGAAEDYTQYVPRGHYTRNEAFQRYFRAMMWLGRMGFRLRPGDAPDAVALGRQQTRQAILIVLALKNTRLDDEQAWAVWQRIERATAFFVGRADDLSVEDYSPVVDKFYGENPQPAAPQDTTRLDQFIAEALTLRPPRITAAPATDRENPAVTTVGLRFMGQRFVFDSYIFQQLVFNQVKGYTGSDQPFTWVQVPGRADPWLPSRPGHRFGLRLRSRGRISCKGRRHCLRGLRHPGGETAARAARPAAGAMD